MSVSRTKLKDPNFRLRFSQRPEDFSRHRKWTFSSLMAMILNRVDRTTAVEVQHFCKTHLADAGRLTKQAFSKARDKIQTEAFTALNHTAMEAFYPLGNYREVHGFLPVAMDGSLLEIPNTPTLRAAFGTMSELARARIAHAFDIANGLCLSAIAAPLTTSERDRARRNIAEVRKILGPHVRILWLEDRGYRAFPFWMESDNAGEYFLTRVPSTFYPEAFGSQERDAWEALGAVRGKPSAQSGGDDHGYAGAGSRVRRPGTPGARGHRITHAGDQAALAQWRDRDSRYQCIGASIAVRSSWGSVFQPLGDRGLF